MNEQTAPTTPAPEPKQKRQRKPKTTTPRKPRVVDTAIAAINAEAAAKRKAHKRDLASGKVLAAIVKRCEKLTMNHREDLMKTLGGFVAPVV
jgi:tryptophanase